ncbi:DUF1707 domain-containing protein [Nonomuraea sp. B12E4]|uniref:DUF1707 SHOCT-like domain-containing protein n=1 Tax=Nonomuraea sp. B12E4 TaxID=3153564 RepID=UPI00325D4023
MSELQMRVSDEDRERTAQRLQHAFAEGRLTQMELEDRLELALGAKIYGDLAGLVSDLPDDRPPARDVIELEAKNGHLKRSGDWLVPRRLRVTSKHGSVDLDLSEAVIDHPVVEIELNLTYGSARITLPEGAAANVDGFQSDWGRANSGVSHRSSPGSVQVVISGRSKYGGVTVRYPRKRWFTQ